MVEVIMSDEVAMLNKTVRPDLSPTKMTSRRPEPLIGKRSYSTTAPTPTDVPSAIRFEGFNAFYGDFQALHDVSLKAPEKGLR